MKKIVTSLLITGIYLTIALTCGCTNQNESVGDGSSTYPSEENQEEQGEGTIERPSVVITDIDMMELTATEATINITVTVHNPNPVGGTFNKISYILYYKDERPIQGSGTYEYLGDSVNEKKVAIETRETTAHICFILENQAVLQALISLAVQGQVWIKIVGTANLNLNSFSYDVPFEQEILVPL